MLGRGQRINAHQEFALVLGIQKGKISGPARKKGRVGGGLTDWNSSYETQNGVVPTRKGETWNQL